MGMTIEEAIKSLKKLKSFHNGSYGTAINLAIEALEQQPRQGHWIEVTNGRGGHECDVCHDYAPSFQNGNEYLSAFCPKCGAKMAESEVNNDDNN